MKQKKFSFFVCLFVALYVLASGAPAVRAEGPANPAPHSTLLVFNTVERLLSGDLRHTVTISDVQANLSAFPADWPVVGVGTTNQVGRNGELTPDGAVDKLRMWWADPGSPSRGDVVNLVGHISPSVSFPFIGLAVGDPRTAITWTARDVPDVHAWLEEKLAAQGVDMAGIQLNGDFGRVKTSVAYNLPLSGLDLSGGYVGDDVFRFGDYMTHTWTVDGLYAADPALTRVISTPGHPLHLHGYETGVMLGGHIGSAPAVSITATIWPLDQMVVSRGPVRPLAGR
jgi:hypothetical protein